jgi:hypothetical protein
METGLFEIEAEQLSGNNETRKLRSASREVVCALFRPYDRDNRGDGSPSTINSTEFLSSSTAKPAADPRLYLAQCFLQLADLPNYALDRLARYEHTIWRQVAQILFTLDNLNRRKPQERKRFRFDYRQQEPATYPPDDD